MTKQRVMIGAEDDLPDGIFDDTEGHGWWVIEDTAGATAYMVNGPDAVVDTLPNIDRDQADDYAALLADRTIIETNPDDFASDVAALNAGEALVLTAGSYSTDRETITDITPANVVICNKPGARAICDVRWKLSGNNIIMRGFGYGLEVTNTDPLRVTEIVGSDPADMTRRHGAIHCTGNNIRVINVYYHNAGMVYAFGSLNLELYGLIGLHTGWIGPDRDHGHHIYGHNHSRLTSKSVKCSMFLNCFSNAITWHTESSNNVYNILMEDCIVAGGNTVLVDSNTGNTDNVILQRLYTYDEVVPRIGATWGTGDQTGIILQDSIVDAVRVYGNANTVRNCTFLFPVHLVDAGHSIDNNVYYDEPVWFGFGNPYVQYPTDYPASNASLALWQQVTGYDLNSTSQAAPQDATCKVVVNEYEPRFAICAVYNWQEDNTVSVALPASYASNGDTVRVRNGLDIHGDYDDLTVSGGAITMPMQAVDWTNPVPTGLEAAIYDNSLPAFGKFLLEVL